MFMQKMMGCKNIQSLLVSSVSLPFLAKEIPETKLLRTRSPVHGGRLSEGRGINILLVIFLSLLCNRFNFEDLILGLNWEKMERNPVTGFKIFSVGEKQFRCKLTAKRNCCQVNLDLFVWSLIHIDDVIYCGVPGSPLGWVTEDKGGEQGRAEHSQHFLRCNVLLKQAT